MISFQQIQYIIAQQHQDAEKYQKLCQPLFVPAATASARTPLGPITKNSGHL